MYIHTGEFTKRFQLFVTLYYTLSIYPSAHNHMRSLRRHLPNTFHKFPCTKMQSNHYCKHCKLIMSNNYIHSSIHYYYILLTMYIISHILFYLLVRPRLQQGGSTYIYIYWYGVPLDSFITLWMMRYLREYQSLCFSFPANNIKQKTFKTDV